ncbi:LANO_0G10528g1_1 [Lachancea nothofagi CBS 11611]|uniref:Protein arginine N-methyltransferase n=1 Tax=Lachancea nothofagi CBS 11611 TaxID=1266666 RepID=A0A1G4KIV7_9SACH|nr:LANO_0G10528g1_1 [Lachancea nothofagi CBS 11611]
MKSNVYVGLKPVLGSVTSGNEPQEDRYDYVLHPITNSRYRDRVKLAFHEHRQLDQKGVQAVLKVPEPQLQELCLPPAAANATSPGFIGLLASWVDLESADADVQELSYQVLSNEWRYATFVGVKQLILAPPKNLTCLNRYALMVARLLYQCSNHESSNTPVLSISLPFFEDSDPLSTWELWCTVRKICSYHPSLTISLALPRDRTPSHVLQRWLAEPVTCLLVSSSIFATNQYNYPVLNKFNQQIIFEFQKVNGCSQSRLSELCVILHGVEKYAFKVEGGEAAYLEYINYLLKRGDKVMLTDPDAHTFSEPRVMPPLDPYSTDISNAVYHTFEQDKTKYELYGQAITRALKSIQMNRTASIIKGSSPLIILVAGAGRGPLVDETYKAVSELKISNYQIIALEKSSRAVLYLQKRKYEYWKDSVEIVKDDICLWRSNKKVDLCISELLGSFGCNELSPECLSSLERYNCKPNTVFIPQKYSSYIAPVSAPLLYQSLKTVNVPNAFERPWVIHNIPYCIISTKINETWSFQHPLASSQLSRSTITDFKIKNKGEIHGLIGFFKATLYDDICLSILPNNSTVKLADTGTAGPESTSGLYVKGEHTPNMASWSPIVFPLKQPFFISDDTELEVFMTRNNSYTNKKFWYEWSASSFVYLVMSDRHTQSAKSLEKLGASSAQQISRQNSNHYSSPPAAGLQKAFGQFQPSPNILPEAIQNANNDDNDMFEFSGSESGFMGSHQSGWKSVQDIHGLGLKNAPVFDLHQSPHDSIIGESSALEEYHVRVKTGVSEMQNVGGQSYSITLR